MPLYWRSTGNGSTSIVSMWSAWGAMPKHWMWSDNAVSSTSWWTRGIVPETYDLLRLVPVAGETRAA